MHLRFQLHLAESNPNGATNPYYHSHHKPGAHQTTATQTASVPVIVLTISNGMFSTLTNNTKFSAFQKTTGQ